MWETVASIIKRHSVTIEIVLDDYEPGDWSHWLGLPTEGYGEVEKYGPFRFKDLKKVLINPIEQRRIGRLVPDKFIDHSDSIVQELNDSGVQFERAGDLIVINVTK